MLNEILVFCPCCGEKIKIQFDGSGEPVAFLLGRKPISPSELLANGIELGIVEGGEYEK